MNGCDQVKTQKQMTAAEEITFLCNSVTDEAKALRGKIEGKLARFFVQTPTGECEKTSEQRMMPEYFAELRSILRSALSEIKDMADIIDRIDV